MSGVPATISMPDSIIRASHRGRPYSTTHSAAMTPSGTASASAERGQDQRPLDRVEDAARVDLAHAGLRVAEQRLEVEELRALDRHVADDRDGDRAQRQAGRPDRPERDPLAPAPVAHRVAARARARGKSSRWRPSAIRPASPAGAAAAWPGSPRPTARGSRTAAAARTRRASSARPGVVIASDWPTIDEASVLTGSNRAVGAVEEVRRPRPRRRRPSRSSPPRRAPARSRAPRRRRSPAARRAPTRPRSPPSGWRRARRRPRSTPRGIASQRVDDHRDHDRRHHHAQHDDGDEHARSGRAGRRTGPSASRAPRSGGCRRTGPARARRSARRRPTAPRRAARTDRDRRRAATRAGANSTMKIAHNSANTSPIDDGHDADEQRPVEQRPRPQVVRRGRRVAGRRDHPAELLVGRCRPGRATRRRRCACSVGHARTATNTTISDDDAPGRGRPRRRGATWPAGPVQAVGVRPISCGIAIVEMIFLACLLPRSQLMNFAAWPLAGPLVTS